MADCAQGGESPSRHGGVTRPAAGHVRCRTLALAPLLSPLVSIRRRGRPRRPLQAYPKSYCPARMTFMPDRKPEVRNEAAPWSAFDADVYAKLNYASLIPEDEEIIRF